MQNIDTNKGIMKLLVCIFIALFSFTKCNPLKEKFITKIRPKTPENSFLITKGILKKETVNGASDIKITLKQQRFVTFLKHLLNKRSNDFQNISTQRSGEFLDT